MDFIKQQPSPSLYHAVRNYWMFELHPHEIPFRQLFFPYGSFELIFYLHGDCLMRYSGEMNYEKQGRSFYSGQFIRSFELHFMEPCKCIGVSFYPWAGKLLFDIPSDNITNKMIPIDYLENKNTLHERLSAAKDSKDIFIILDKYLLLKLVRKENDEMVQSVINTIIRKPEKKELGKFLDKKVGLSRRRIEQRFLENAGLPMTQFIRKIRFQKSLHKIKLHSYNYNLTQVALDSGYYDQAHFINEFKLFAGVSPLSFIKQKSNLKEFIQSLVIL
jgi:AraC-like DNA-binding protein